VAHDLPASPTIRGAARHPPGGDLFVLDLPLPLEDPAVALAAPERASRRLAVVILTRGDVTEPVCYLTRAVGLDEFFAVMRSLEDVWPSLEP
jgi:hypothetical protein